MTDLLLPGTFTWVITSDGSQSKHKLFPHLWHLIELDRLDTEEYLRNGAPVLWYHSADSVIGRTLSLRREAAPEPVKGLWQPTERGSDLLIATMKFLDTSFARMIRGLVLAGKARCASVGCRYADVPEIIDEPHGRFLMRGKTVLQEWSITKHWDNADPRCIFVGMTDN